MSEEARRKALNAATELLAERGLEGFSVDEVARRTRVSKATIYRHWPRGLHLAIEAWGIYVTTQVPTLSTGATLADLRAQMLRLATFYRGPDGVVIAQLLGAAAGDAAAATVIRESFFGPRRESTLALIDSGAAEGQIRGDLPADLIVDMLFGPTVFRLVNGMGQHSDIEVNLLADVLLAVFAE